jgi:hypothetical protein
MPKMKKFITLIRVYLRVIICSRDMVCRQKDSSETRYRGLDKPITQFEVSKILISGGGVEV